MCADTDNIAFSSLFALNEVPECFLIGGQPDSLLKQRVSRREKEAAEREGRQPVVDSLAASFKISPNTKWFDKYGKACTRPTNVELEGSRWMVQIDFARREKDPTNPLKPSGYWVNAIMIAKVEENPFEGHEFEHPTDQPQQPQQPSDEANEGGLPF